MSTDSTLRQRLLASLPVDERRVECARIATAVLEAGSGPPLILLHGPGEHAPKWLRVLPELARHHRVVAPDLPGHGANPLRDGELGPDRVLTWLDELIDATCASPPALVGQILGGAIAARYARTHGDRLSALVLVDSLGLDDFRPAPEFGAALTAFVGGPAPDTHDHLWERCAHDLDRLRGDMGDDWEALRAYNLDRARDPGVQAAQQALMGGFGLSAISDADLAAIDVETTLIWGRHDLATPLAVAERASRRHGWPLHVIDGAGDDPPIERPEAFTSVLRATLETGVAA